jgi:hypothetical protein
MTMRPTSTAVRFCWLRRAQSSSATSIASVATRPGAADASASAARSRSRDAPKKTSQPWSSSWIADGAKSSRMAASHPRGSDDRSVVAVNRTASAGQDFS